MTGEQLPRAIVATGPDRDELVVPFVVWTPDDAHELMQALAGQGQPAEPIR